MPTEDRDPGRRTHGQDERAIDEVRRILADDPALYAALRDGVPPPTAPSRGVVAIGSVTTGALIGFAAVAGGLAAAISVAVLAAATIVIVTVALRGASDQ